MLVLKDAPNDLLVRTDIQLKLGLSLVTRGADGRMTDLFRGQRVNISGSSEPVRVEASLPSVS